MKQRPWLRRIWWWHVLLGVPVAAFLHSVVQFAYSASALGDLAYFIFHFASGVLVGSVILVPAYSLQALLFASLWSRGLPRRAVGFGCGVLQAAFVGLWWFFVGVEPSLGGRFRMGPVMMTAAFVAGALVAYVTTDRLQRSGHEAMTVTPQQRG